MTARDRGLAIETELDPACPDTSVPTDPEPPDDAPTTGQSTSEGEASSGDTPSGDASSGDATSSGSDSAAADVDSISRGCACDLGSRPDHLLPLIVMLWWRRRPLARRF